MRCEGEWREGDYMSFFEGDNKGGTKVLVEEIKPGEHIKTKHVAMVDPQNVEIEPADEMSKKWIGSREDYYFKAASDNETTLEVMMTVDEAFQEMFDETWPKALQYFKEICES